MIEAKRHGATTTDQVITTKGLAKSFRSARGSVEAVRGVSIGVNRGEIFGFLGPNGAGKTTSLRMLTTLLPIDSGTATVAGFDVATQPNRVRSAIGYVSQLGGADDLATGRENLILQGRLYGGDLRSVTDRAAALMDILDLSEFADRRVKTYSGGQRRRLDIALGIIHEPEVLFLDEPSTGLDPQNRANLWDHVRALQSRGTTVFLTTHYLEEADALCDRLVIMDHGEIVVEGTPRDLKRQVAGESVVLSLRDEDGAGDRWSGLLAAQPYVREITTEGEEVRLYVEEGSVALPQILRLLDGEHIGIRSMSLSEPTLDDVFLRQTGRSLRDTGSAGPPGPDSHEEGVGPEPGSHAGKGMH
jgi:ABC-2 type transport system ATP-binding protein